MIVEKLVLQNFMRSDAVEISLPETGVVLITGLNGCGKSTIIEAVSYGIWKKTLRGTTPWRKDVAGSVEVHAGGVASLRKVSKAGSVSSTWRLAGGDWQKADTETKTQAEFETHVGSHELWRRTHVFSSSDAAHFSTATDSERKSLIENILGLSVFDIAYEIALRDQRGAAHTLNAARARCDVLREKLMGVMQNLATYEQTPEPVLDEEPPPARPAEDPEPSLPAGDEMTMRKRVQQAQHDAHDAHVAAVQPYANAELDKQYARAVVALAAAESHLEMVQSGKCGTCFRDFADGGAAIAESVHMVSEANLTVAHIAALGATAKAQHAANAVLLKTVHTQKVAEWDYLQLQRDAVVSATTQHADWVHRRAVATKSHETTMAQWDRRQASRRELHAQRVVERRTVLDRLTKDVFTRRGELLDVTDAVVDAEAADLVAQHVAKVLSARGVRAFVLGEALIGVEQVANAWLSRMAPGIQVAVKAYSENKTGTVSDRISLEVTGAGGGYGYDASSGGERRRVDAAILLALAEVSAAARGIPRGTLFLDEVFDAVDSEGVPLVAEAIEELGKTRPVVVITHSQELARHMTPVVHLRADCGALVGVS